MKSLSAERGSVSSKKKIKPREIKITQVAHDLSSKPRTEDVKLSKDDLNKDFSSLMLSEPVLKGLKECGFIRPSPIQLAAIPNAKIGLDMIVQAKSGTGKTCVYVVTALEMLKKDLPGLQVVVLAPTREIAMQGLEVASQIGAYMPGIKIASFIGGLPLVEDKMKAVNCQMAIGTPGRMKQMLSEKSLNPDTVRLVILDEADKLLEQSFLTDTTAILDMLPSSKQVMTLSATYPDKLAEIAEQLMRSPQHIRLAQENQVLHGVKQFVQMLESSPSQPKQNQIKQAALLKILSSIPYNQCLVFTNYQIVAQSTADFLNSRGFPSICISAGQDQLRRLQSIQTFKTFKCRILCSTDLTARGIDAENVNLVINYDVPEDHNTYLHRIGRGGRFGSNSTSVSLAPLGKEEQRLRRVVFRTGSEIKIIPEDTIPKNLRDIELPLLEGIEAPIDLSDQIDNDSVDEGDNKTAKKKDNSGKIKRRGKKKKDQNNDSFEHDKVNEESRKENLSRDAIENILKAGRDNLMKFNNADDLANMINKSEFMLNPNLNAIDQVQKIADQLVAKGKPNTDFDKALQKSKEHLGYRSVRDILDFVASNKELPEHSKPTEDDNGDANSLFDNDECIGEKVVINSIERHDKSADENTDNESEEDIEETESSSEDASDDSSEEDSSDASTTDSDSEQSSDSPVEQQYYSNQSLQQQQYANQYQQQTQQQQSLHTSRVMPYTEAQLREWYSNVSAQSRQIEMLVYQRTLQSLRQNHLNQ